MLIHKNVDTNYEYIIIKKHNSEINSENPIIDRIPPGKMMTLWHFKFQRRPINFGQDKSDLE